MTQSSFGFHTASFLSERMNSITTALDELDRLFSCPHPGAALFRPGFENIGENGHIEQLYPQIVGAARKGPERFKRYLDTNEGAVDFVTWHLFMLSAPALAYIFPAIIRGFAHLDVNDKFDSSGPLLSSLLEFKHGADERLTMDDRQIDLLSKIFEIHFMEKFENHGFDYRLFSFMALFNRNLGFFEEALNRKCSEEAMAHFAEYLAELAEAGDRGESVLSVVAKRAFISIKENSAIYAEILKERGEKLREMALSAGARGFIERWLTG